MPTYGSYQDQAIIILKCRRVNGCHFHL